MGLKHLFLCIFAKAKYRLLSCVDQGSHSPESPIAAPLSQHGAVKSDEDNVVVNNRLLSSFHLRKINQPSLQPINPDNTVTLQAEDPLCVGPCSTLSGTQLPKPPNLHTDDATIALVPLLDKNPSVSVPWLQPRLLNRTLFDQCSSLLTIRASSWRKNFTLKSLISRALPHQDTVIDPCPSPHQDTREVIVNINAVFPLTGPESRNELLNQPLSPVNPARELSHKTLSEPPVNESDEVAVVIDTSKHRPRKDHPKTTGIDKEQIDRQYYKLKALPEIPQQETVNELEPEEVILYPRNDELEVLRRRFSSSPQVEESSKALSFLSTLPEMGHGPIVGGLLFRPPPTPQSLYPSNSLSFLTFECFPEKDPSAVIDCMPLEITQRGVQVASPYASASKLLPLESSFLLAAPGSEYSMWDSLFFSLDVYVKDGLKSQGKHINLHHDPWNIRFIGKGASGKVFCVGYKTEVRDPDSKVPGVPSVAFAKQSQVASVKVIDMRKQTLGTLEGLASEVVALKVLRNRREEVSKAKARGKRMRYSDGLHFLLESAYLPGIDDIAILRAERLYLLTKYYYCDLSNYGFKVSNDERSLSFILSELTQGLNYLHHIGIVHLDLKPSNVFVTHDRHCVIGDLGSSIYQPGFIMAHESGLLVDMVTSYTDGFCAPEIMQSRYHSDRFNFKADFWSLGVTIYNIVRPDGLLLPRISKHGSEEYRRQRRNYDGMGLGAKYMVRMMYDVGCPGRIVNLVLNMCQRDPKKRLGGRGIIKNLKDQGRLSSPLDMSPLPDVSIQPCGPPESETEGPYLKVDVKDACEALKEHINSKGYNLTIQ